MASIWIWVAECRIIFLPAPAPFGLVFRIEEQRACLLLMAEPPDARKPDGQNLVTLESGPGRESRCERRQTHRANLQCRDFFQLGQNRRFVCDSDDFVVHQTVGKVEQCGD
jgi:hypothetical protein